MKRQEFVFASGRYLLVGFIMVYLISGLSGCKNDTVVNSPQNTDYILTQSDLDNAAVFLRDTGVIGDTPDMLFEKIHIADNSALGWHSMHDTMTILHSMRTIYENQVAHLDSAKVGAIYIRKYYSDPSLDNHHQRTLTRIMLMVKRSVGFFPDGGDWEYTTMDASGIAYHPNGVLPPVMADAVADTSMGAIASGKLRAHCGNCHEQRKGMSDLFFK